MALGTDEFIGYPAEKPPYYCMLMFKKYSRAKPGDTQNIKTEATFRLPIPQSLVDQFGMDITDPKLDILGNSVSALLAAGGGRIDQFSNDAQGIEIYKGMGISNFLEAAGKFVNQNAPAVKDLTVDALALFPGASDSKLGKWAQREIGMVRNPHHTMIFDGVQLKSYTFSWKLSPRSQEEANTLEEILRNIKYYMHPQLSPTGFSMEYPHLAEVKFKVGTNTLVPNVKTSFLKSLAINGSAGGVPSFYRDGKSTIVEFGLSFQEINVQTRDDFMPEIQQATAR
jgi:hypothetical protein